MARADMVLLAADIMVSALYLGRLPGEAAAPKGAGKDEEDEEEESWRGRRREACGSAAADCMDTGAT